MTDLRNPYIRTRDIRKLVSYKSQTVAWDQGCDETSEWVMASLENLNQEKKLVEWLSGKGVAPNNEAILVDSTWSDPCRITWESLVSKLSRHFGKEAFQLYDIDLKWVLEYQTQEIARFGRYTNA